MAKAIAGAVALVFVILILVFGFSYTVDQTERGVLLRNGAMVGLAGPGRGYKWPVIDSVVRIPTSQQTVKWAGDAALEAYSFDQQPANISVSVTYHIPPEDAERVYAEYGSVDNLISRLLERKVPQDLKTTFGHYTAVTVIQKRDAFNAEVAEAITKGISGPLVIDGVQVENIEFSKAYVDAVEKRMLQEVEVQRIKQTADQEQIKAEITVIQAQAQADSAVAQAKADGEAKRIAGEAEGDAIRARGSALKDFPGLVALTAAERWDGKLPGTMVPGAAVPFVNVGAQ